MWDYGLAACNLLMVGRMFSYLFQQYSLTQQNNKKIQQIENCKKYRLNASEQIDLDRIKRNKQPQVVYIQINKQQLKNFTTKTFTRNFNTIDSQDLSYHIPLHMGFIQNCCGSSFVLEKKNKNLQKTDQTSIKSTHKQIQDITVDIRDCSIHSSLLKKRTNCVFIQNKSGPTIKTKFQNFVYHTSIPFNSLGLIGTIQYSVSAKKFIILPNFMLGYYGIQNNLSKVIQYIKSQNSDIKTNMIFGSIAISVMLFLNWRKLKTVWASILNKITSLLQQQNTNFQDLSIIEVKGSQKLKCQCGSPVNIIYQCRHLNKCQTCNRCQQIKKCKICGKTSDDYIKVYI